MVEHDIPEDIQPPERSEDEGILLRNMSRLNQNLLGALATADGETLPRLTMRQAVGQLYEWSVEYRDHPDLARDFAAIAARLARRLPRAGVAVCAVTVIAARVARRHLPAGVRSA